MTIDHDSTSVDHHPRPSFDCDAGATTPTATVAQPALSRTLALEGIQAKLRTSQPTDPHEREADAVAERLTSSSSAVAPIDRFGVPGGGAPLPSAGGGARLPAGLRDDLGSRLSHDFSGVRIHTDAHAGASARSINALAFTRGNDIAFAPGQFAPHTSSGRRLLAHELTHVVQQSAGRAGRDVAHRDGPVCSPDDVQSSIPPIEDYSCPAELTVVASAAPPGPGASASDPALAEMVDLRNPVLEQERRDYYVVPVSQVFPTQAEADEAQCEAPAPGESTGSHPSGPSAVAPPSPGPVAGVAPPPAFRVGQVVYALDGPLIVVGASAHYVVTDSMTKFAVGAGSTTLVRTEMGWYLVDAGMHQTAGSINATLADVIVDRLAARLGTDPLEGVNLTHIHLDHTALVSRVYARWDFGVLSINALQALLPSRSGVGTQLDDLIRDMSATRRARVSAEVRTELSSTFGPWDLYFLDPTLRQSALDAEVARQTELRLHAMRPTQIRLMIPTGGGVVATDMPLGTVTIPPALAPDAPPITGVNVQPGMVTILDPGAGAETTEMLAGGMPSNATVDRQSSTYVIALPNGSRLMVVSDQRAGDIAALRQGFEAQLARIGHSANFQVWDMTHHMQTGWSDMTLAGAAQLSRMTRVLSDYIEARNSGGRVVGDAVIVSVHGPGEGQESYIDPAQVWLLRALGFEVFAATGGSSVLTAAQDVSVIQVELGGGRAVSGVTAAPQGGRRPDDPLLRRASAAIAQLETHMATQETARSAATTRAERATIRATITAARDDVRRIETAVRVYRDAVAREIGRSHRDASASRPDVAPAVGAAEPAATEAAALRALLVNFTAPVVGEAPHFTAAALVVVGREQMTALGENDRELLVSRSRVRELAEGLRWSASQSVRHAVASALDHYRSRVVISLRTASPASRSVLEAELAHIDADMTRLTGVSAQQFEEMRRAAALADEINRRVVQPLEVTMEQLGDPSFVQQAISQNNGFLLANGQLYHVTQSGETFTTSLVPYMPAMIPRSTTPPRSVPTPPLALPANESQPPIDPPQRPPQPPANGGSAGGTGLPAVVPAVSRGPIFVPGPIPPEFLAQPNILNISGRTVILEGAGSIAPTPSQPMSSLRPGELIVRGYSSGWFVADPVTRRPIAAAGLRGGEMWQVEKDGRLTLLVDAYGNVQAQGQARAVARGSLAAEPYGLRVLNAEASGAAGPGRGARVVAGGVGLLVVANELLAPISRLLQQQRFNIARSQAIRDFWTQFGANPTWELRTQNSAETQPAATGPTTSVLGDPVYYAVTAIDVAALEANLGAAIRNYQDFLLWTDMGVMLGAIRMEPHRSPDMTADQRAERTTYTAWFHGPSGDRRGYSVDLTELLERIEQRTLADLDRDMRQHVAGLTPEQRRDVHRLKHGSETRLYRLADSGWIHGAAPIRSASSVLGPDPWVRVLERRGDRARVEAANADARRSALVSAYQIDKPIDEVLEEVQEGGRPVLRRWPESGDVQGFVAGPMPGSNRFGDTRYYPHQQHSDIWTVAIGQLNEFWVDLDELESVDESTVNTYGTR